jgi:hypothetical protein
MKTCLAFLMGFAALAHGALITFEAPLPAGLVPNSSFIQGSAVDAAAQVTNQFEDLGILLGTVGGSPYAVLIDLGTGHAVSGTNGIGPENAAGDLDYTLNLDIFLVVPGTTTPAVTDSISIQGDEIPIPGNVIFDAYDLDGNLIASGTAPDTAGGTYALSAPGIHEFQIHSESGTVAYDNLSFDTPGLQGSGTGAPEPATYGLIGLGLAGMALAGRRISRQRAAQPGLRES